MWTILVAVEKKYNFDFPDEQNLELAKEIYKIVSDKTKYADWVNKGNIRAELQCDIIILLAENGFPAIPKGTNPPEDYQKVYNDVIEQAENFRKYYR